VTSSLFCANTDALTTPQRQGHRGDPEYLPVRTRLEGKAVRREQDLIPDLRHLSILVWRNLDGSEPPAGRGDLK
jgi:hypothetical protein